MDERIAHQIERLKLADALKEEAVKLTHTAFQVGFDAGRLLAEQTLLGRLGEALQVEVPEGIQYNISVKLFIPDSFHMREMLIVDDSDALTDEVLRQAIRENIALLPKPKENPDGA